MPSERLRKERAAKWILRAREDAPAEHKNREYMKVIEYVVQDCPIMGKIVIQHYLEEVKEYGKR